MYIPKNMLMSEVAAQQQLIKNFGFAVLISHDCQVSHLPLFLDATESTMGVIYGHMAIQNPQWKALEQGDVKAVFNGPHSYISPSWYASHPAVPTWNYAAVHAIGKASLLSAEQTMQALHALVNQYEPALLDKQHIMSQEYQTKLAKGIVGFKITLHTIEGKHKLGQHKSLADQQGTVRGLENSQHPDSAALLAYMQQTGIGMGI